MDNLLTDLMGSVSGDVFSKISQKAKIPAESGSDLGQQAFSLLFNGITKNARKKGEAEKIKNTLGKKHSGDLNSILSGRGDGAKILGHIFGEKETEILEKFAEKGNINSEQAGSLLESLAPVFMNQLAKNKAGNFLSFLDTNKNGSIIDEVIKFIFNLFKKK